MTVTPSAALLKRCLIDHSFATLPISFAMQNLGQFPVKINHHLGITDEERDALVNACAFFHEFFTEGQQCVSHWRDVARDQRLELFDQLATKIARI